MNANVNNPSSSGDAVAMMDAAEPMDVLEVNEEPDVLDDDRSLRTNIIKDNNVQGL